MVKYHVAVAGSRPLKNGNRNAPFALENIEFVGSVLNRVPTEQYATVSHTATGYGVDQIAETHAQDRCITQRQFPAYWFDPTKEKNLNKAAGIAAREAMIRNLSDMVHNKDDEFATLLVFHTTENVMEDDGLKRLLEFVTKYHAHIQVRTFRLPVVTENPKVDQPMIDLSESKPVAMPDPFAVPQ